MVLNSYFANIPELLLHPENIKKNCFFGIFSGYKMGILARIG